MNLKKHSFTLIELIVSMAVFALLSMMVVRLFSASQKLWVSSNQKSELSAEGRMALDTIANLLMSATTNPQYDTVRVGSDYFVLKQGGPMANGSDNTSQLYFVTKSRLQSLMGSSIDTPVCFIGVQVAQIAETTEDDPDAGCYVLVVGVKTSTNSDFVGRFPDNTEIPEGCKSLPAFFDIEKAYSFDKLIDTNSCKVSRIAANVIDFQIRTYSTSTKIGNGNGDKTISADDNKPEALEIELTLMDRKHYTDYLENSGQRATLRNQYGRTFRRVVWLNGANRTDDLSGDWE